MSESFKFVKVQHYMINVCHVMSVKQGPHASDKDEGAWTLTIRMVSGELIKFEHYPEREVHDMFSVFEKLLIAT